MNKFAIKKMKSVTEVNILISINVALASSITASSVNLLMTVLSAKKNIISMEHNASKCLLAIKDSTTLKI